MVGKACIGGWEAGLEAENCKLVGDWNALPPGMELGCPYKDACIGGRIAENGDSDGGGGILPRGGTWLAIWGGIPVGTKGTWD